MTRSSVGLRSRVRGCLLGGAIGDAFAAPFEGVTGPVEALDAGGLRRITDDTELTLATCEAIVSRGRLDIDGIAQRYVDWFRAGKIHSPGASTLKALRDLAAGAHWALAGARGEYAAGSGAAMRAAPLAFLLDPDAESDRVLLRDYARITHHHEEAYAGALAVVLAVRTAASADPETAPPLLDIAARALPDCAVRDRLRLWSEARGEPHELAARLGSSGYVAQTVPAALYLAQHQWGRGLRAVVGAAIQMGGDTDTIAAIAGQITGAAIGASELPAALSSRVANLEEISRIAESFASFVVGCRAR